MHKHRKQSLPYEIATTVLLKPLHECNVFLWSRVCAAVRATERATLHMNLAYSDNCCTTDRWEFKKANLLIGVSGPQGSWIVCSLHIKIRVSLMR